MTAVQGAGAALAALGAFAGAVGQRQQFKLQAEIAAINASMAQNNARYEMMRGQRQEQAVRLKTAQLKGTQRATLAGRGIDLGAGSAARTLATTDIMGEIDANQVAANAVRAAWGQRTQATGYSSQAAMSRSAASAVSPFLAAGTSLIGSAARVDGSWYAGYAAGSADPFGDGLPPPRNSAPTDPPMNNWGA